MVRCKLNERGQNRTPVLNFALQIRVFSKFPSLRMKKVLRKPYSMNPICVPIVSEHGRCQTACVWEFTRGSLLAAVSEEVSNSPMTITGLASNFL
jgi:hypothetical protein